MSLKPVRKVSAGAIAGVVTTLVLASLKEFGKVQVSGEYAAALTTGLTFIVSWFVRGEAAP